MKRCTSCKRIYADDGPAFCADDGTQLVDEAATNAGQPLGSQPSTQQVELSQPPARPQQQSVTPSAQPSAAYQQPPRRRKALAIVSVLLACVATMLLIFLGVMTLVYSNTFRVSSIARIFVSAWGVGFIFAMLLTGVSVLAGSIAIFQSIKNRARYGGRILAIAGPAVCLVAAITTIGLFALRRIQGPPSYSTTTLSNSTSTNTQSSGSYARDFIKASLGPFKLSQSYSKAETEKSAFGFTSKFISGAHDVAAGNYKSSGSQSTALMACSYETTGRPEALMSELEKNMRASSGWTSVQSLPQKDGRRVEARDAAGAGMVMWTNGQWLFLTMGDSLADATSLADNVGY
jgi:hypothetical protein